MSSEGCFKYYILGNSTIISGYTGYVQRPCAPDGRRKQVRMEVTVEQGRQCTHNLTIKRIQETNVAVEKQ
jgi:hypothetical protein